jgi:twitching motility protein PilT
LVRQDEPIRARFPTGWKTLFDDCIDIHFINAFGEYLSADWESTLEAGESINRSLEVSINNFPWRFRCAMYTSNNGNTKNIMFRRLPPMIPNLMDLGLEKSILNVPRFNHGLVLITGATRSGKSTTLASILNTINQQRSCHILTIEDPIEYKIAEINSIITSREVGIDCCTFASGAYEALRQCPEVIAIGEIRDSETARCALEASESGHLVFGTLHANSAAGAIKKFTGLFSGSEQAIIRDRFALSLQAIIAQVLLPGAQGDDLELCSEMIFNHRDQFSDILFDTQNLVRTVNMRDSCKLSYSMAHSIQRLVSENRVKAADAARFTGIGPTTA